MKSETTRRLAAIVSADVVGYSRLMGADETGTLRALRGHRGELIDPLIASHGGRTVKTMGDGLLLEFPSAVDAVTCAVAIQTGMIERNTGLAEFQALRFRIGVHIGDIIVEGDDIFGDGVNVTTRIEALADPDGIAISDDAYRQVRDRLDVVWLDAGEYQVKNIARGIAIWRWAAQHQPTPHSETHRSAPDAASQTPAIAVLPFENRSGDPEQTYFADGITEDIITQISKTGGLLVISRNSTFTYKGKAVRAQNVCRDLGVRYVLEGSVRKAGERVRITAQLVDGHSGLPVWADRYDRELADIFAVQDDVTEQIVQALAVNLIPADAKPVARLETAIPAAYDCVLRGREQYRLFTQDGNVKARCLYEQAIALDPNYAAAYAGLAVVNLHEWFLGSATALDRALDLARKAEALDPSLPLVYEALGNILLFKREYDKAFAAIRTWIKVEPGNADAYANLAGLLQFSGEPEQVAPLIERAIRLNPFHPFYYTLYAGQALTMMERYAEAVETLERCAARNPAAVPPHLYLAVCYGLMGKSAQAKAALAAVLRVYPGFSLSSVAVNYPYRRESDAARLVEGLRLAGADA